MNSGNSQTFVFSGVTFNVPTEELGQFLADSRKFTDTVRDAFYASIPALAPAKGSLLDRIEAGRKNLSTAAANAGEAIANSGNVATVHPAPSKA